MFTRIADRITAATGSPKAFAVAVGVVVVWSLSGPVVHYSDTWQLTINTGTTIVTFLMVFLIQASTNRIGRATQLKLDELIVNLKGPEDRFAGIEALSDKELDQLEARIRGHREARASHGRPQPMNAVIE